jgi:hypothetical protein
MEQLDKKEFFNSMAKSIFSIIPYAGTAITELVFEYNGRIRQKRLNKFVEFLSEGFLNQNELDIENIKTEHFNDVFEAVIKRVFTTKSETKLKRFRDILIKELKSQHSETELIEIYLELISILSDEEIIILHEHRHFDKNYNLELDHRNELNDRLNQAIENKKKETIVIGQSKFSDTIAKVTVELELINKKHKKLECLRKFDYYNITDEKFLFYKQRLYSKGLLIDSGIGRIGVDTFQMMSITEFGKEFVEFIKEAN